MKKKQRISSICPICKVLFVHPFAYRKSKYCSNKCWSKRNPQVTVDCVYCGKLIWVYKSQVQRKKYCSRKCYALNQRLIQKGANSHLWKGGATKENQVARTRAVYREWRLNIFDRDNYTCQICGKRSGSGKRVVLHAHHIEEFSENLDKRYDVKNGTTLCVDCHTLQHPHLIKQEIGAKRLSQEVLDLE